jgi:hypothetical protein
VGTWQVIIEPGSQSCAEVLEQLSNLDLPASGISIELREPLLTFRGADPAVIVATIGVVSTNLTVLISGLLQRRTDRKNQRISIELASGDKVDVPPAPDAAKTAQALHHAIRVIRAEYPDTPALWAAHIHVGP